MRVVVDSTLVGGNSFAGHYAPEPPPVKRDQTLSNLILIIFGRVHRDRF
jgi:hypothetical protein